MYDLTGHKFVGSGQFTRAYQTPNKKHVILFSLDPVKEYMGLGWFPECGLFPKIETLDYGTYKSKYYPIVSLKELNRRHREYYDICRDIHLVQLAQGYHQLFKAFSNIKYKYLREALVDALTCINNENVQFEISPRNIRVHKGKLILLDCFFIEDDISKSPTGGTVPF